MADMNFKQEDFDFTQEFARFVLNKMYVREASVKEMLDFNKMLVRYNELCRKIEANIFDVRSVTEPEPKPKKSKSAKTGE
jgi:hypothetical protein